MAWTHSACPCFTPWRQKLTQTGDKEIINISHSFSAVTNISKQKSALSNIVSLGHLAPAQLALPPFQNLKITRRANYM